MTVAGRYDKVTANKGTLNQISMWCTEAAQSYEKRGLPALAAHAREFGDLVYEMLKETGYYEN